MKKLIGLVLLLACSGCIEINPVIQTTKSYEGHFYKENEIQNAIQAIHLEKGESVWILSNTTLKRVLKNNN